MELPALAVQPPPNPLDSAGKLLGLQGMLQQQKIGAVQLQQAQQSQKDTQAMTAALRDWDASQGYDALTSAAIKNGASSNAVFALQQHVLTQRAAKTKLATEELDLQNKKNDLMLGKINQLKSLPDEQLPQALGPAAQELTQQGLLDPQHAQQVQQLATQDPKSIRDALDIFSKGYQSESVQNAREIKEREVSAQEMAAQARKTAAEKPLPGQIPLGPARVDQLNQMMTQRFQVLHPGQPLFPTYQLPPNATERDFDRADKMLEAEERAQGTQAQLAVANSIRQQTAELAHQASEDRHQTAIMQPVVGTDKEGNRILVSVEDAKNLGLSGLTKADADLQNKSEAARHWLTLATKQGDTPDTMGIQQLIDKMDKEGKLGVVTSRWNDFMAGKVGAGDAEYTALRAKMGLANTKLMQAHVGSRGGAFMLEHFEDLANAKKMNADTLKTAVASETSYMQDVAMLPKSQRGTAPSTPAAPQIKVGDKVTLKNGQTIIVKAVHADGSFD